MRTSPVWMLWILACGAPVLRGPNLPELYDAGPAHTAGPTPSFVPRDSTILARFELARFREMHAASLYADVLRHFYTYRWFLEEPGWDPVTDLDQILVSAPTFSTNQVVVVLRVHDTVDQLRERVEATWERRGEDASCRESAGVWVCPWPSRSGSDMVAVLVRDGELALGPVDDAQRLLEVAIDLRARGESEPMLASVQEAYARVRARNPSLWPTDPHPEVADIAVYPSASGLAMVLDSKWTTEAEAANSARDLEDFVRIYEREPVLSGLAHLLAQLHVAQRGEHVEIRGEYSETDIAAILAAIALLGG